MTVAVLIAAYNEESVIEEKLMSILNHIPSELQIDIYIGSDASSDHTDEIVKNVSTNYPNVHLTRFSGRTGKAAIINTLAKEKNHDIFILTDANVIFSTYTLAELLIPFDDEKVAMVCANIQKTPKGDSTFEALEKTYIDRENRIKQLESDLWKIVIGAEGGCYAIRRKDFIEIPKNFFMDDFFMTMQVIENKKHIVFQQQAVCYEDIPDHATEEFKRKKRISIGNFQNLARFKHLLNPTKGAVSFAFFSHKVLRWFTPFFLLALIICSGLLSLQFNFMLPIFCVQVFFLLSPWLSNFQIRIPLLSSIIHFFSMNIALFLGFLSYVRGVKSSIWEPTSRTK
jgi:cellulose synthase/poly-beta-1,6-N-acetylglucosamine synthase-like glycosyltransferase